jgi:hypothetical protein
LRFRKIIALTGAVIFFSTNAEAEIGIEKARYASGVLVVRGETSKPFQIIVLDGQYKRRSDKGGHFVFRIPYRPRFCKIDLTSGSEVKSVEVENCKTYIRRIPSQKKPN